VAKDARQTILSRRASFIAAALAGVTAAASDCGGKAVIDDGMGGGKTTTTSSTTGPQMCLSDIGGTGGEPQPCLDMPMGGTGGVGAGPCLGAPGGSGL